MSPYCFATCAIFYSAFFFCCSTMPTTLLIWAVMVPTYYHKKCTNCRFKAKISPKEIITLINICMSQSKISPKNGMIVQEATIWINQKAIHLAGCSLLKIVPIKGNTKQARRTNGDNNMTRNIKLFINMIFFFLYHHINYLILNHE